MRTAATLVALVLLLPETVVVCQQQPPRGTVVKLPVKEVTVFKDGHAFVLHEGTLPVDASGDVSIDALPSPVLGTFWPYSADKAAKLVSVTASQQIVTVDRTALNLRELLEANAGADVLVSEKGAGEKPGPVYPATIVGIPTRSVAELEATGPPDSGRRLPVKGDVILLKIAEGTKAVTLDRIQDVTFKSGQKARVTGEEFRNRLLLRLDWKSQPKSAAVGYVYLQKGIRWFPSYKVVLDDTGGGNAQIKLQATLLNEMTDLNDVTVHLVIGVPSFAMKELNDPLALQQAAAQLSPHFQTGARTQFALTNAMMSQVADISGAAATREDAASRPAMGPEVTAADKSEDMFVFTVNHVTLRKGERMVVPVAEFGAKYQDVFTLDVPFIPPPEVMQTLASRQQSELTRLMAAPKVLHKIRLQNKSSYPFTTAPALVVTGDRLLAQGMMTYTAIGAACDLEITTAVDVKVEKSEKETARIPNAMRWQNTDYARVDLAGILKLFNYRSQPVILEVTRQVMGNVTAADHQGAIEKTNVFESPDLRDGSYPYWWGWYNWPAWWSHFNGAGRIQWKLTLEAGKSVDLGYAWHYFWR
jgi:hypothetical protein